MKKFATKLKTGAKQFTGDGMTPTKMPTTPMPKKAPAPKAKIAPMGGMKGMAAMKKGMPF